MMLRCGTMMLLALGLAGCAKPTPPIVPASGVLTIDGLPLGNAELRFYPEHEGLDGSYIASAVTDSAGKFTLLTNGQSGAVACVHKIVVDKGPAPAEARGESAKAQKAYADFEKSLQKLNHPVPDRFKSLASSTLTLTITADQAEYKLELKR